MYPLSLVWPHGFTHIQPLLLLLLLHVTLPVLQLEEVVTVHKKHTSALEKALRCLDNDAITSEEIDPLKDDLDYYLVSARIRAYGVWLVQGLMSIGGTTC
jgi:hypothetical protein